MDGKRKDTESVKKFIISNPDFLDDFIVKHVSQDRVKAWLKDSIDKQEKKRKESDPDFTAELMERSFRHRRILLITRSRLLYPARYNQDELRELIERPYSDDFEAEIERFPMPELCYFLSSLKANYHNIEYHNYSHALSHAQSMYWILRKNPGVFSELEMKCLLIAAISHDVGHPGVNDGYLKATGGGLEKLYLSPILENHHTQTCFLILQVLDEIQHAILSTSLNRYKAQSENMRHFIATDLDFQKKPVRDATKSVLMMTCDLCASWKTWQEHKNTVWSLYKEFFSQGDKEMNLQINSIPQMMRMNAEKIPEYQGESRIVEDLCVSYAKQSRKDTVIIREQS